MSMRRKVATFTQTLQIHVTFWLKEFTGVLSKEMILIFTSGRSG
jgi:hypothetical protein